MNEFNSASSHKRLEPLYKHIVIIICLLVVQFFSRSIWRLYYSEFQRPNMLKSGANLCQSYTPILPDHVPPECDIVLVQNIGNLVEETFYAHQGEIRVEVFTQNRVYVNEVSSMLGNIATLILPLIGFVGIFVSTLHKIIRTGAFFRWELAKHPSDAFEKLLLMYSLPLFLSSFVFH